MFYPYVSVVSAAVSCSRYQQTCSLGSLSPLAPHTNTPSSTPITWNYPIEKRGNDGEFWRALEILSPLSLVFRDIFSWVDVLFWVGSDFLITLHNFMLTLLNYSVLTCGPLAVHLANLEHSGMFGVLRDREVGLLVSEKCANHPAGINVLLKYEVFFFHIFIHDFFISW